MSVTLDVNGREVALDVSGDAPLLYVLRNDLELNGPKFGCGLGQCGACTVLVDGAPERSCLLTLSAVRGKAVTTLEGLGTRDAPHPVQEAFIAEQALQCGYCANGMILAAVALLRGTPHPTDAAARSALDPYLCRCGTHARILRAVQLAAKTSSG